MRLLFAFLLSFLIAGCGYKPVVEYSKTLFEEPVLVKVKLDPEDASTGEYLQDEIAKMTINRLNLSITENVNKAKSYILVNSYTINTTPVTKDDNGNVIRYSINAAIEFAIKDKQGFWSKNIVASEYVSVKAQSSVSATAKDKAMKLAIKKALDNFVIAVMQRGQKFQSLKNKQNNNNKVEDSKKDKPLNSSDNYYKNTTPSDDTISIDNSEGKPLVNLVVVDNDTKQNGNSIGINNANSTPTDILSN